MTLRPIATLVVLALLAAVVPPAAAQTCSGPCPPPVPVADCTSVADGSVSVCDPDEGTVLVALARGNLDGDALLAWTVPAALAADRYNIYRGTDVYDVQLVAELPATAGPTGLLETFVEPDVPAGRWLYLIQPVVAGIAQAAAPVYYATPPTPDPPPCDPFCSLLDLAEWSRDTTPDPTFFPPPVDGAYGSVRTAVFDGILLPLASDADRILCEEADWCPA